MKKRFEVKLDTYNVTYSDNSRNSYTIEVQIPSYTRPEDIQYAIKCEVEAINRNAKLILSYTRK